MVAAAAESYSISPASRLFILCITDSSSKHGESVEQCYTTPYVDTGSLIGVQRKSRKFGFFLGWQTQLE